MPMFGLMTPVVFFVFFFRKLFRIYIVGLILFPEAVSGTHISKF